MADVTEGQVPAAETQVANADTATDATPKTFSEEYVKELRAEAAKHRTELQALKAQQEAAANANLSEAERLKKEVEKLTSERDAIVAKRKADEVNRLVEKASVKTGLDPELASSLLKTDDLDIDEDSTPKEIEKRLRALVAKWPHISKTPDFSATNGGTGSKPSVTFTRSQLRDPAFYRKHEKEILQAQREGRITDD